MPYFAACFGTPGVGWADEVKRHFAELMEVRDVEQWSRAGWVLLSASRTRFAPQVFVNEEDGWIILQGVAVDVKADNARPQLEGLLREAVELEAPAFDRLEGAFAVAIWDARRSVGWFWNDHGSTRNFYYCEVNGNVYVSTAPVVLAKSLGRGLDEFGVRQLLTRGCLLAPTTMFDGVYRVCVGERGRVAHGRTDVRREWLPCLDTPAASVNQCAERVASVLTDRMRRLRQAEPSSIADLTGGFDSRVLNLARHQVGDPTHVTVNGDLSDADVQIAKELSAKMGWPLRHFSRQQPPISGETRDICSIRTAGELAFDRITFHLVNRQQLAEDFNVQYSGSGGELMRYYPWYHEFTNIGRRQPADARRTLTYRYSHFGEPPETLFRESWFAEFQDRLGETIRNWFAQMPGTLNTQQQDALYVWKMTSHSSLWISATAAWLPSMSPLLMRGVIDAMVAIPWRHKITSRLQRRVNHVLSPQGAAVRTQYGTPGGKWKLKDFPSVAGHALGQSTKLSAKVLQVLRDRDKTGKQPTPPFLTAEFRGSIAPDKMLTIDLYNPAGLRQYLSGSAEELRGRAIYLSRIATIEHLARAIGRSVT